MHEDEKYSRLTEYLEEKARSVFDIGDTMTLLRESFPARTFCEEFKKAIYKKALATNIPQDILIKKLKSELGAQNFSSWWNGLAKSGNPLTISRDSAIKIAFALGLDAQEAQQFLTYSCGHNGFYMRDYKDLIYVFFLNKKNGYTVALDMIKKHSALDCANPNIEYTHGQIVSLLPNIGERITDRIKRQFDSDITTSEELNSFLEKNATYFGSFRRKAYEKFIKMYGIIKSANDYDAPTDDEICQMVLMNIPSLRGANKITNEILIKIAENTLPRSGLSEIINKTKDPKTGRITQVNRKHLILIWLLVYGGRPSFENLSEAQDAFEECITNINFDLLEPCGMSTLDPRNPFDWLVINALYYSHFEVDTEDTDAVERIHIIMSELFKGSGDDS